MDKNKDTNKELRYTNCIDKKYSCNRMAKKITKKCVHPGCGVEFIGTKKSMYCVRHKNSYLRRIVKTGSTTVKIVTSFEEGVKDVVLRCSVDGCYETYTVRTNPEINRYTIYCENHRNAYKRKLFTEGIGGNKNV